MSDQVNGQPNDGPSASRPDGQGERQGEGGSGAPWQAPGVPATGTGAPGGRPWQPPTPQAAPGSPYAAQAPSGTAGAPNPWTQPSPGGPYAAQAPSGTPAIPNPWAQPTPPAQDGYGPGYPGTFPPPGAPPGQGWGSAHPQQGPARPGGPYGGRPFPPAPLYQAPPKPGVIPLRPLGLGEILDGAFQACRKNPLATFGTAVLLQAVVALVTVLLLGNAFSSLAALEADSGSMDNFIGALAGFSVFAAVTSVVSAAALLVLQGILVIPTARAVINQGTSFGQAWRIARGRLLPLIGFGLLTFAAGLLGLALVVALSALAVLGLDSYSPLVVVPLVIGAVVALVWASMKIVVAPATLMLEGTGPWSSVKRSWSLTRGNWWRTFGIVLLTSVIVSIIGSVVSFPLTFAVSTVVGFSASASGTADVLDSLPVILASQAIAALFSAIGYAFQAGVTSLLYVDLRIRREGFDVVLMREHERAAAGPNDFLPGRTASFGHQPGGPA